MQYDSCRGLEGWTVFNFALDDLYDYKLATYRPATGPEPGTLADDPLTAHRHAVGWVMIQLTRAMATLVIQVSQRDSEVKGALREVTSQCADFVEWRKA